MLTRKYVMPSTPFGKTPPKVFILNMFPILNTHNLETIWTKLEVTSVVMTGPSTAMANPKKKIIYIYIIYIKIYIYIAVFLTAIRILH